MSTLFPAVISGLPYNDRMDKELQIADPVSEEDLDAIRNLEFKNEGFTCILRERDCGKAKESPESLMSDYLMRKDGMCIFTVRDMARHRKYLATHKRPESVFQRAWRNICRLFGKR